MGSCSGCGCSASVSLPPYWGTLLKASGARDVDKDGEIEKKGLATLWRDEGYRAEIDVNKNGINEPEELLFSVLNSPEYNSDKILGASFRNEIIDLAVECAWNFAPKFSQRAGANFADLLIRTGFRRATAYLLNYVEFPSSLNKMCYTPAGNYEGDERECPGLRPVQSADRREGFSKEGWEGMVSRITDAYPGLNPEQQKSFVQYLMGAEKLSRFDSAGIVRASLSKLLANKETFAAALQAIGASFDGYYSLGERTTVLRLLKDEKKSAGAAVFVKALKGEYPEDRAIAQAALVELGGKAVPSLAEALSEPDLKPDVKKIIIGILEKTRSASAAPLLYAHREPGAGRLPFPLAEGSAIEALIADGLASNDPAVLSKSQATLIAKGDTVVDRLAKLCAEKADLRQCSNALPVLGGIGTPKAYQKLALIFGDAGKRRGQANLSNDWDLAKSLENEIMDKITAIFAAKGETGSLKDLAALAAVAGNRHFLSYIAGNAPNGNFLFEAALKLIARSGAAGGELDKKPEGKGLVAKILSTNKYDLEGWLKQRIKDQRTGPALRTIAKTLVGQIEEKRAFSPVFVEKVEVAHIGGDPKIKCLRGREAHSYQYWLSLRVLTLPKGVALSKLYIIDTDNGKTWRQEGWQNWSNIKLGRNTYTIYLDERNQEMPAYLDLFTAGGTANGRIDFKITNPGCK